MIAGSRCPICNRSPSSTYIDLADVYVCGSCSFNWLPGYELSDEDAARVHREGRQAKLGHLLTTVDLTGKIFPNG